MGRELELVGGEATFGSDEDARDGGVDWAGAGCSERDERGCRAERSFEGDGPGNRRQAEPSTLRGGFAGDASEAFVPTFHRLSVGPDDAASGRDEEDVIDTELGELLDRPLGSLSLAEREADGDLTSRAWLVQERPGRKKRWASGSRGATMTLGVGAFAEDAESVRAAAVGGDDAAADAQSQDADEVVRVLRQELRLFEVRDEDNCGDSTRDFEVHIGVLTAKSAEA